MKSPEDNGAATLEPEPNHELDLLGIANQLQDVLNAYKDIPLEELPGTNEEYAGVWDLYLEHRERSDPANSNIDDKIQADLEILNSYFFKWLFHPPRSEELDGVFKSFGGVNFILLYLEFTKVSGEIKALDDYIRLKIAAGFGKGIGESTVRGRMMNIIRATGLLDYLARTYSGNNEPNDKLLMDFLYKTFDVYISDEDIVKYKEELGKFGLPNNQVTDFFNNLLAIKSLVSQLESMPDNQHDWRKAVMLAMKYHKTRPELIITQLSEALDTKPTN